MAKSGGGVQNELRTRLRVGPYTAAKTPSKARYDIFRCAAATVYKTARKEAR